MIYDMKKDEHGCRADLRRGENFLRALGYQGWTDGVITATFAPQRLAKAEKSASPFRAAAFQAQDGTVYETGAFHDVDSLPPGVEVSAEGFVDQEGRFHTREQATELLDLDHQVQSEELDLKKGERPFRAAAYRHADHGRVYETGPFHSIDPWLLGGAANHEATDPSTDPKWVAGFVTHDGQFMDREQALAHVTAGDVSKIGYSSVTGKPRTTLHASDAIAGLKKGENNSSGVNNSFFDAAGKYLEKYGQRKIDRADIQSRIRDHKETLEAMATRGGQHQAFAIAARMAGHPADAELRRRAEEEHGDDVVGVALAAHGLDPHDESLRMSIEAAIQELRMAKSEFNLSVLPRVVMPGQEGSDHMAMVIRRAFADNLVYEVRLGGRHSAGTACAYDREADRFWLLKPGSGRVSPALGVSETPYSQSRREAAFAQAVRSYEAMRDFYPECWLLLVDGKEVACMEVMGPGYRPAQKYGDAAELLKPYQDSLDIYRWACWDWVLGNPDDHGGNVLVTEDGRVSLIDHGSALAGKSFNPPADPKKSFIPYYLRVNNADIDWEKISAAEKYRCFPQPTPEERDTLKAWMKGLGSAWEHVIESLAPEALPACRARLDALLQAEDPADALLRAWAGLAPSPEGLQKSDPWSHEERLMQPQPKMFWDGGDLKTHWRWATIQKDSGVAAKSIIGTLAKEGRLADLQGLIKDTPLPILFKPLRGLYTPLFSTILQSYKNYRPEHEALATAIAHRYVEEGGNIGPGSVGMRDFSSQVLTHAPEDVALQVMQAVDKMPEERAQAHSQDIWQGWSNDGLRHNQNLGRAFGQWATKSKWGPAFLGKQNPALGHVSAAELKPLLTTHNLVDNPDLLWAPQISPKEAAQALSDAKDLIPHSLDQVLGSKDWKAKTTAKGHALGQAVFNHPRATAGMRIGIASEGSVPLTSSQLKHAIRLAGQDGADAQQLIPQMVFHQYKHSMDFSGGQHPDHQEIMKLVKEHASPLMHHLRYNVPLDGPEPMHWMHLDPQQLAFARNERKHGQALTQFLLNDPDAGHALRQERVRQFWNAYEHDVSPHHFAVMQRHLTKSPDHVEIDFHRQGKKGSSAEWGDVDSQGIEAHAKAVQKQVLADPNAIRQDIDGKPHVLVYRGVAGNYAKQVLDALHQGATDVEIPNAQLSSWSGTPEIAEDFAERKIKGMPDAGVVLRQWLPVEDIVHSGCHKTVAHHQHAHPGEHELVFQHRQPTMKVFAGDIGIHRHPQGVAGLDELLSETPAVGSDDHRQSHLEHAKSHAPGSALPGKIGHYSSSWRFGDGQE